MRKHGYDNAQASTLVEFTMLLPFLCLIIACGCELYRGLQIHQQMSVIAREIGSSSIRNCNILDSGGALATTSDLNFLTNCLNETITDTLYLATSPNSFLREANITVKAVRGIVSVSSPLSAAPLAEINYAPSNESHFSSQFSQSAIANLNSFKSGKKDLIITTEIFLKLPSIAPGFGGSYYETTVF